MTASLANELVGIYIAHVDITLMMDCIDFVGLIRILIVLSSDTFCFTFFARRAIV